MQIAMKMAWYINCSFEKVRSYPRNCTKNTNIEYAPLVKNPRIKPFSFPFAPVTKPPINITINDRIRVDVVTLASVSDVSLSNNDKIKLIDNTNNKIVKKPKETATAVFFIHIPPCTLF